MSFFNDTMYQAFLKNPEQFGFTYEVWKEWYSKQLGAEFKTSFPKKYFTKLLPVKGEIKKGMPIAWWAGAKHGDVVIASEDVKWPEKYKITKLFLCSKDIQIGDVFKFIASSSDGRILERKFSEELIDHSDKENWFKVIGEISPDVTWVKEGAEFSEDEVIPFWRISIETWSSAHKSNNVMDLGSERYPEYFTEGRIKTILQYYCDENYISARTLEKPFVAYYELKGPCGHFH